MIKEMDLNQNPKKISYDEYYKYFKIIIKKYINDNKDETTEDNIIKIINEIENSEFNSNIDFIII